MADCTDCPFCHVDQRVIIENKLAVVILSNPRKVLGHSLVIPKRHIEKPWELTSEEILATLELVLYIQKKIIDRKITAGCDLRQNYRPFLEQSRLKINHVHYHIIPRGFNDEIFTKAQKNESKLFADLSEKERHVIENLLKH